MMKFNTAANHCSHALQSCIAALRCIFASPVHCGEWRIFSDAHFYYCNLSHNSKHGRNLYRMWCRTCLDLRSSYTVYGILYSTVHIVNGTLYTMYSTCCKLNIIIFSTYCIRNILHYSTYCKWNIIQYSTRTYVNGIAHINILYSIWNIILTKIQKSCNFFSSSNVHCKMLNC